MKFDKIHNKGQATLFQDPILESLTKAHPLLIWGIYLPIVFSLLYYSIEYKDIEFNRILASFGVGIVAWTLFEYLIHRFAFHFTPKTSKAAKIVYVMHGNHHQYPRDKYRLFMPPVPSLIISLTLFFLFYLIATLFKISEYTYSYFAGFMIGYLIYGTIHYAIHAWNPPFKWMKPLWRNHHMHHYKEQEKGFGVSSTIWDHVFGTMFDLKKEKDDPEKVRELIYNNKVF